MKNQCEIEQERKQFIFARCKTLKMSLFSFSFAKYYKTEPPQQF